MSRKRTDPIPPEALAELERQKRASAGQLLLRAARLLNERAISRIQAEGAAGVRLSHTALLPHIDFEGTRVVDLAARVGVTKQAVSKMVDELEALGLLERAPDPDDRRAKRVRFTEKGLRSMLYGLEVLRALEEELAGELGPARMDELRETLAALVDILERP